MIDPVEITTLAVVTFLAFTIAGVTGFGGGLFVMPVLLLMLDPREAGPIIGLVQLVAAASRAGLNWEGISWPIVKRLALTSLPIAAVASYLFVVTPAPIFTRIFGCLLLLMVVQGHTPWNISKNISLRSFLFVGAANGLVSGYLGPSGPVGAPFYLAYGLTGVAFVGTSSAGILMTQLPENPRVCQHPPVQRPGIVHIRHRQRYVLWRVAAGQPHIKQIAGTVVPPRRRRTAGPERDSPDNPGGRPP